MTIDEYRTRWTIYSDTREPIVVNVNPRILGLRVGLEIGHGTRQSNFRSFGLGIAEALSLATALLEAVRQEMEKTEEDYTRRRDGPSCTCGIPIREADELCTELDCPHK